MTIPSSCLQREFRLVLNRTNACYQVENTTELYCMFCVDGDHDGCHYEKTRAEHISEGIRNPPYAHPCAMCMCPCTDKRTKQFKILQTLKMNLQKYLLNNKGITSYQWKGRNSQ